MLNSSEANLICNFVKNRRNFLDKEKFSDGDILDIAMQAVNIGIVKRAMEIREQGHSDKPDRCFVYDCAEIMYETIPLARKKKLFKQLQARLKRLGFTLRPFMRSLSGQHLEVRW